MEQYRSKKGLTGRELAHLFSEHNVYGLILDNYFLYHIESPDNFIKEIDEYVEDATGQVARQK
jgi:hypothetical protein